MTTVLIYDDDEFFGSLLSTALAADGFQTISAVDFASALRDLEVSAPAAIVMSADLQHPNSSYMCREFRNRSDIPIVMLGTDSSPEAQLIAFAAGADDYLAKPFDTRVFLTRLAHHIGRHQANNVNIRDQEHREMIFLNLSLDIVSRRARVGEFELPLTRTEFDLLALLMSDPTRVFTRRDIYEHVWHDHLYRDDHLLESHCSRLRLKIRKFGGPHVVIASRGVGYQLSTSRQSPIDRELID